MISQEREKGGVMRPQTKTQGKSRSQDVPKGTTSAPSTPSQSFAETLAARQRDAERQRKLTEIEEHKDREANATQYYTPYAQRLQTWLNAEGEKALESAADQGKCGISLGTCRPEDGVGRSVYLGLLMDVVDKFTRKRSLRYRVYDWRNSDPEYPITGILIEICYNHKIPFSDPLHRHLSIEQDVFKA